MDEDLAIGRGVEDRAACLEVPAQLGAINQIAVVGKGDRALVRRDDEWLGVAEHRATGGGIADVPERGITGQPGQTFLSEDLGDVPHLFLGVDLGSADDDEPFPGPVRRLSLSDVALGARLVEGDRGDPGALLPPMLQRVQAEVNEVRGILMVQDAEDAAFIVKLVEHGYLCQQSVPR